MELQKPRTCEMDLIEIDDNEYKVKAAWHNPEITAEQQGITHRKI